MSKRLAKVTGTLHYDDGSQTEFRIGGMEDDDYVITLWRGPDIGRTIDANTDYTILRALWAGANWFLPLRKEKDAR